MSAPIPAAPFHLRPDFWRVTGRRHARDGQPAIFDLVNGRATFTGTVPDSWTSETVSTMGSAYLEAFAAERERLRALPVCDDCDGVHDAGECSRER